MLKESFEGTGISYEVRRKNVILKPAAVKAVRKHTVCGHITDAADGETLIGAAVDNKDFRMEYKISVYLETFTESLYNHVMSRDIMTDVISSFLSEAPVMYSNVRGGLGTICSAACDTVNIILGADE